MPCRTVLIAALLLAAIAGVDTAAAQQVSVADPGGGKRWTARQSTGAGGRICVSLTRGSTGKGTTCSQLSGRLVFSYNVRTEHASTPRSARTVLVAAFAPTVVRARLQTPDGPRTYRRRNGRPRVLLAVLAGRVERPPLRVEVKRGSRTVTVVEGPAPAVTVADPLGGAAWRSRTAEGSGGGVCVAWERVPPRFAATPSPVRGTARCGDAGAVVPVAAAQTVDGRLVVFGLAGADVRSAVVRTPSGDRMLALEPKTHALLAVLGGGTDPSGLSVVARLADGRQVERPIDVVK